MIHLITVEVKLFNSTHSIILQTFTAELTEGTIELSATVHKSGEGVHVCLAATTPYRTLLAMINQE